MKLPEPTGFRGFPVGTVAFYGPDDRTVTKILAAVVADEAGSITALRKWRGDDLAENPQVSRELAEFFAANPTRSLVLSDGILGCPHDEGVDYPEGAACPHCPFWSERDRRARTEPAAPPGQRLVVGFLYYRREQWDRWKGTAVDPDEIGASWILWRDETRRKVADLRAKGYEVFWENVDVEEFLAWCDTRGYVNDAQARSRYVAERLRKGD
jgi:hypothetical protein